MELESLEALRRTHPAWRLLTAEHAPLVIGFLYRSFIQSNTRTMAQPELVARLEDLLHEVRGRRGDAAFPRPAASYLDDWAADERGWLRKYYPPASDEPHFDLTPAAEKAIDWIHGLQQRQFVSTESRLLTVFELLRQLAEGTTVDPEARIGELEKRRAQIDAEIQRVRQGRLSLLDPTQVKDRFLQMSATARALLTDFRELEQNFRELDRQARERIAVWDGSKGALLEQIFGDRDAISDSDQGKSFRAFWDFLMSPARQEELSALLAAVFALAPVKELAPDPRLLRVHYDWLEAGEIAQRTVARLSQQLRRYLDDQVWLENRRIMQLLREVEQAALAVRNLAPEGAFMEIDEPAPAIELPMERPLFTPPFRPNISTHPLLGDDPSIAADALFDQIYVDKARLAGHIRRALQTQRQISLADLVASHPLEHGLAELIAYFSLAAEDRGAIIDEDRSQTIVWTDASGQPRQATLPTVIFTR
jgi:Protein of unknown function (DUF3375)